MMWTGWVAPVPSAGVTWGHQVGHQPQLQQQVASHCRVGMRFMKHAWCSGCINVMGMWGVGVGNGYGG